MKDAEMVRYIASEWIGIGGDEDDFSRLHIRICQEISERLATTVEE